MLGRINLWRHLVVLFTVLAFAALAFIGFIGTGTHHERFDAKQVTVTPGGGESLNYREVVDQDFGNDHKHGYERKIPDDFGAATNITASSPNANADVHASDDFGETDIRIGDPNTTFQNQHRYILNYTLPAANLSSGSLDIDIIGTDETLTTGRFDVVLSGFQLANTFCSVGPYGTDGGCTLAKQGADYTVSFAPLPPGSGITLGGDITGFTTPVLPPIPALPTYRPDHRHSLALAMIPIGLAAALLVLLVEKLLGRNEVFSGGAADAAFGTPPVPSTAPGAGSALPPPSATGPPSGVVHVTDAELERLATTEFVPPSGLQPWQGAALLRERVDDKTVSAWVSGMVANGGLTLTKDDKTVTLGRGERYDRLAGSDQALVDGFIPFGDSITLGTYHSGFATTWKKVKTDEVASLQASGWWKRHPPRAVKISARPMVIFFALFLYVVCGGAFGTYVVLGLVRPAWLALTLCAAMSAIAAFCMYSVLLPVRSATGSAMAIRTESFRRFLAASEGPHVEWAWKNNLLREYSAWAVALDAAEAWSKALEASNIPPPERLTATPLLVHSMSHSFATSHTAPSSSGGGGGGFSGGGGGFSGGGGGGGSSGSW
ncbi:MAG: hypothetical protein JWM34_2359 [Ilumatobacteraceae bacterium]|nr:hypothetical protein [Ilumatobacteraceae bacterium]